MSSDLFVELNSISSMNKKALITIALFALGLCIGETHATNMTSLAHINKWEIADPPQGYEKINLQGTLMYGIGPNAVVAGANDNSVYIHFNQSFGNVSITIYNGAGLMVYNTVANTDVQPTIIIPLVMATTGTYTVVLDNASGYAEGDFEHD